MELVITKEMAIKTYLHGACSLPKIGKKISAFSTSELIWAEDRSLANAKDLQAAGVSLPLWVLSKDGSGDGSGYGYGDGAGSGSGYGYGYGYGDGSGDGYGYGDGAGSGYGYGYGSGYGYGYGDGSGDGYGYGDGFKVIEELLNK